MALKTNQRFPLMCLTQDGLPLTHAAQAERLCAAGARWIQLRVKAAEPEAWLAIARETVAVCRRHGALCVVNDSVEVALTAGADGVHLGKSDEEWPAARRRLGPHRLLGGTVNNAEDAQRAVACGCLDYVGVGPLRFTDTKKKLAPVLGLGGVQALIRQLGPLPAWMIGGVECADLAAGHEIGAAGVAVSGALFRDGAIEVNTRAFLAAWPNGNSPAADRMPGAPHRPAA